MKKLFTAKKMVFLSLFLIATLLAMRINFSKIIGAEAQYFTLFQFFAPIAGSFLGSSLGGIIVLFAQLIDYFISGKAFTFLNLLRLTPMLFAVFYFANYRKKHALSKIFMVVIPLIAMALFIIHPEAGKTWYYSLYWLIPVFAVISPKWMPGKLFLRSLGATFTAHAIGTIAFLYTVPMTASQWQALIPVVAFERILFAVGIAVSYVVMNTALDKVVDKLKMPSSILSTEKEYVISRKFWMPFVQ